MIKTVIIDDELHIRNAVRNKLIKYFKKQLLIVGEADGVKTGVTLINTLQPDLLLLDIELSDGTSFDLLKEVSLVNCKIIFITGFNEHAIKAIRLGAIDYLLKPINDFEFKDAISKVLKTETPKIKEQIKISDDFYYKNTKNRIVLKTFEAYHIIDEDKILYCKSDGNYTTFYIQDKKPIVISKPLKKAKELLSEELFIRPHQSYLVNVNFIEKYLPEGYLIISDTTIPVASRRKDLVVNRLSNMK